MNTSENIVSATMRVIGIVGIVVFMLGLSCFAVIMVHNYYRTDQRWNDLVRYSNEVAALDAAKKKVDTPQTDDERQSAAIDEQRAELPRFDH